MANVSRETRNNKYNVIIIGAGICGSEAAALISRYNLSVLIINISMDNPGYIKYGNMISDKSGKTLDKINRIEKFFLKNIRKTTILQKKGEEQYQGIYVIDRKRFSLNYKYYLESQNNIDTRQGLVQEIKIEKDSNYSVILNDGEIFKSEFIIISCGTFLNGMTIFGDTKIKAGRHGEISSINLVENLKKYDLRFERKTALIPACIDGKNININEKIINKEYISGAKGFCDKHVINTFIRENLSENNMNIKYEINLNRVFSERKTTGNGIQYFTLYPESTETNEYNIENFICTETEPLQEEYINKMYCLEEVILARPSYIIKHDGIKSNELTDTFESKRFKNIFFPGEINGARDYLKIVHQGILSGVEIVNKFYKKKLLNIK